MTVDDDAMVVQRLVAWLRSDPDGYAREAVAHPGAARLTLPDGTPAPEALRQWAAFDNRLPLYLAAVPSDIPVATPHGVAFVTPMADVLREVRLDSTADELVDEPETVGYLEELLRQDAEDYPGFGVILEPPDHPEHILWLSPAGVATVLVYRHDELHATPWGRWLHDLFEAPALSSMDD